MSEKKPVKCSEVIGTCKYSCRLNSAGIRYCDYFSITECRRGCDPEACTKYERKKKKNNNHMATFSYILDASSTPKTETKNVDLNAYKYDTLRIARDLCYGKEVLTKISNAKSSFEIDQIMIQARHNIKDK